MPNFDKGHLRDINRELQRHKFVADHTSDAVYWVHRDGRFFYVNDAACKMLGYSRDELLSLRVSDVDADYPPDVWDAHWKRMQSIQYLTLTTYHSAADGSRRHVLMQVHYFEFDGDEFIVGTASDLSRIDELQREQASLNASKERIAESERRFRELADISAPCWITEADSSCSWLNRAWLEYTGATLDQHLGYGWTAAIHLGDLDATTTTYQRAVANQCDFTLEYRLRRHDGKFRLHQAMGRVRLDQDGRFNGFSGLSVDIHDQRLVKDQLLAEQQALKRSNEDLQQFASIASHDLQEPLRKIKAYSQLVMEESGDRLGEDCTKYLQIVIDGGERLTRLVRDLLEFSRITTHARQSEPVDMGASAEGAISQLEIPIKESHAAVQVEAMPPVTADRLQVETLLQNLIANAIQYRSDKEPVVQIGHSSSDGGFETFFVSDNGIGIDPAYHARIFDVFQRLHGKQDYGAGSGIGLASCQRIVDRFGGKIWVESTLGVGSRFLFSLPACNT